MHQILIKCQFWRRWDHRFQITSQDFCLKFHLKLNLMVLMAQACYRFKNDGVRIASSETKTYKKFSQSQQIFPPSSCKKRKNSRRSWRGRKKCRKKVRSHGVRCFSLIPFFPPFSKHKHTQPHTKTFAVIGIKVDDPHS